MKKYCILIVLLFMAGAAFAAEIFVVPYAEKIDVTTTDRVLNMDGVDVNISITRPPLPFKKIAFTFTFSTDGQYRKIQNGYVLFNMKMDMGEYKSPLKPVNHTYTAEALLPKCMKGGKRWFGKLVITADEKERSRVFILDLK